MDASSTPSSTRSSTPTWTSCTSISGSRREQTMKVLGIATLVAALAVAAAPVHAQVSDGVIKIGVLNDQSSLYADLAGQGSVVAARMAVEDFGADKKGMKVEIVSADHQNKPDVGSSIARQWLDVDKDDVIVGGPDSGVALAPNQIVREKGTAPLISGAATPHPTAKACPPT